MKGFLRYFILSVMVSAGIFCAGAQQDVSEETIKSGLRVAVTPEDSLKVYYDLFDFVPQSKKPEYGWKILGIAERTGNQDVLVDMIPQVSVFLKKDDNAKTKLLALASKIEDDHLRRGVEVFVRIMSMQGKAMYVSEAEKRDIMMRYATMDTSPNNDLYQQINDLARMVIFVGNLTTGNLYMEYLDRLEKLIDQLPDDNYFIRNIFYTMSANAHSAAGNHEKAIEMDKKLLDVMDKLEVRYAKEGRKYRNYDRTRYISYRRMLSNYEALPLDQVKDIYVKCAILAENESDVKLDFYEKGRPTIYRKMAEKDYVGLIPMVKRAIEKEKNQNVKRDLYGILMQVADSLHDNSTLLPALKEYNKMLLDKLEQNSAEAYRELQVRFEVEQLQNDNTRLEIEKRDSSIETRQKLIVVALASLLVLAVIIMFLYRNNFRLKRNLRTLRDENVNLNNHIQTFFDDGFPADSFDAKIDKEGSEALREEFGAKLHDPNDPLKENHEK